MQIPGMWRRVAGVMLLCAACSGCERPKQTEDERIRRQAAEDTRQIKQDAKSFAADTKKEAQSFAADTKKEALQARRQVKAAVAGVKEGLADPSKPGGSATDSIDINSASAARLETLPGVSPIVARRIIANRPYDSTDALVTKAHMKQEEYDRISDSIVAN
jgi:DNA uptake protein ComE-like DNA-binding protein